MKQAKSWQRLNIVRLVSQRFTFLLAALRRFGCFVAITVPTSYCLPIIPLVLKRSSVLLLSRS